MNFTKFLTIICIFTIAQCHSFNAIAKTAKNAPSSPTKITAKVIDIQRKLQIIEFNNNVIVEKNQDSILADKMILFYEENNQDKITDSSSQIQDSSKIKKLEAIGNVKIFNEEFVATAKKGYYQPKEDLFILENEVIVNNGISIAKGNKFIYNFKNRKGKLIGGVDKNKSHDQRAIIIIGDNPKKSTQSSNKKSDAKNSKR